MVSNFPIDASDTCQTSHMLSLRGSFCASWWLTKTLLIWKASRNDYSYTSSTACNSSPIRRMRYHPRRCKISDSTHSSVCVSNYCRDMKVCIGATATIPMVKTCRCIRRDGLANHPAKYIKMANTWGLFSRLRVKGDSQYGTSNELVKKTWKQK